MKRIVLLIILIIFSQSTFIQIFALNDTESMLYTYNELSSYNSRWSTNEIDKYDKDIWVSKKVFVLPYMDGIENIPGNNKNNGEYRYLGINIYNDFVNNPEYPDDHVGSEIINRYKWIEPHLNKYSMLPYIQTRENLNFYKKEIFYFLENEYGNRFDETEDPMIWLSRAQVIVPVSEYGRGVLRFEHLWDSNKDGIEEAWYITVNLRSKSEAPEWRLSTETNQVTPISVRSEDIDADVNLRSNTPSDEIFDSDIAIPSGEQLYVNIRAREYIHSIEYLRNIGTNQYDVVVTKQYRLRRWNSQAIQIDGNNDGDFLDPEDTVEGAWEYDGPYRVTKTYEITRSYCYYTVNQIGVYRLTNAEIYNDALLNGKIELSGEIDYPVVELTTYADEKHVLPLLPGSEKYVELATQTIGSGSSFPSVPDEDFYPIANASLGEILVRNDRFVFDGKVILSDTLMNTSGEAPKTVPIAELCESEQMQKTGIRIPEKTANGVYATEGTLTYEAFPVAVTDNGGYFTLDSDDQQISVATFENVAVHTPVVCNPLLDSISKKAQNTLQESNRLQLVLEETFRLNYPTVGMHITAKGYGSRDYALYTEKRQVQFPFDIYIGDDYKGVFVAKNTWSDFDLSEHTYFIPSWAKPGDGHILFRSIPINIPSIDDIHYEFHANLNPVNYKAVEALSFHISSKIEAFKITDCRDDNWLKLFSSIDSKSTEKNMQLLPLIPGIPYLDNKIPTVSTGVMLGYPIEFEIRTNGRLADENDYIYIRPKYSFVPEINGKIDMSQRIEVDLYNHTYYNMTKIEKSFVLDQKNRTAIGDPNVMAKGVLQADKVNTVQLWRGKFFLPNMTYCVPKGTVLSQLKNLDVTKAPFLHKGYIIVNFEIFVYDDLLKLNKEMLLDPAKLDRFFQVDTLFQTRLKNGISEYLTYGNGWLEDGFKPDQNGLMLQQGDVIFYSTEQRASQTYY